MALVYRPLGYSGTTQRLTVDANMGDTVTVYLWGGGGGGGGNDSSPGGYGQAGGYSEETFSVSPGDTIDVAVGGAGGGGAGGSGAAGGIAGGSFQFAQDWSTLEFTGGQFFRYTNRAYCPFLNTYGVWQDSYYAATFDQTVVINFPYSGYYTITGSCDNYGYVYIDGVQQLYMGGFQTTYSTTVYVNSGNRSVRIYGINTGGPGAVGVVISGASGSYSGAPGGRSGYSGSSGAGGGGGGATVVLKNGSVVAVAGGGAGGGGGGNRGAATGQSAPGSAGTSSSFTNGAAGADLPGDGGGGGAGGGGYRGGNGGGYPGGDQGAYAGTGGTSLGSVIQTPSGRTPYSTSYYPGTVAYGGMPAGGNAGSGYAVVSFGVNGLFVNSGGTWAPVQKTWIKQEGAWTPVKTVYVKKDGIWLPVISSQDRAPVFATLPNTFGISYRPYGTGY